MHAATQLSYRSETMLCFQPNIPYLCEVLVRPHPNNQCLLGNEAGLNQAGVRGGAARAS
jgi:hypothetical protein